MYYIDIHTWPKLYTTPLRGWSMTLIAKGFVLSDTVGVKARLALPAPGRTAEVFPRFWSDATYLLEWSENKEVATYYPDFVVPVAAAKAQRIMSLCYSLLISFLRFGLFYSMRLDWSAATWSRVMRLLLCVQMMQVQAVVRFTPLWLDPANAAAAAAAAKPVDVTAPSRIICHDMNSCATLR